MSTYLVGMPVDALRAQAKVCVMRHFVGLAESDKVPPTQRAMYVRKLDEAVRTLADPNYTSPLLTMEANARNEQGQAITRTQLAQLVVQMASPSDALEVARIRVGMRIDAAPDDGDAILAVLAEEKITFSPV